MRLKYAASKSPLWRDIEEENPFKSRVHSWQEQNKRGKRRLTFISRLYREVSICGVCKGSCSFFFFFSFSTWRLDVPSRFHWWDFRKSLNAPDSHPDLWQLIALISLKLTAKTKLDSQTALCAHCSWQVLIRATFYRLPLSLPFHPVSVIIPSTSPHPPQPSAPVGAGALKWQCAHRGTIGKIIKKELKKGKVEREMRE